MLGWQVARSLFLAVVLAIGPMLVSAPQLWDDYKRNPATADIKYKNKRMVVLGHIREISATYTLYLEGGQGQVDGVTARLADNEIHRGNEFKVGQAVALNCIGAGIVFGEPIVLECHPQ